MPDYIYQPKITGATFTPNPASTNQTLLISVTIVDQAIDLLDFTARSGDVHSGEI